MYVVLIFNIKGQIVVGRLLSGVDDEKDLSVREDEVVTRVHWPQERRRQIYTAP